MSITLRNKEFLYLLSLIKNKDPSLYTDMDKHLLFRESELLVTRLHKIRTKLLQRHLDQLLETDQYSSLYRKHSIQFQMICSEEINLINRLDLDNKAPHSIYVLKKARQLYHTDKPTGDIAKFLIIQEMYGYAKQNPDLS